MSILYNLNVVSSKLDQNQIETAAVEAAIESGLDLADGTETVCKNDEVKASKIATEDESTFETRSGDRITLDYTITSNEDDYQVLYYTITPEDAMWEGRAQEDVLELIRTFAGSYPLDMAYVGVLDDEALPSPENIEDIPVKLGFATYLSDHHLGSVSAADIESCPFGVVERLDNGYLVYPSENYVEDPNHELRDIGEYLGLDVIK